MIQRVERSLECAESQALRRASGERNQHSSIKLQEASSPVNSGEGKCASTEKCREKPQVTLPQQRSERRLTLVGGDNRVEWMANSVSKIQIGQLWKKDGTNDTYLVTRVYTEVLSTMATLRKSGSETEALVRVKVERTPGGQTLAGFSPAQEDERF
jgi:hypothetical protein